MIIKNPIIKSLLETDAYKINMHQVILHQFNKDRVVWTFRCRNNDVRFTPIMIDAIKEQIDHYCTLRFTEKELEWLGKNFSWLQSDYIDFLRIWRPNRSEIRINEEGMVPYNGCGLSIEAHGTWLNTMMYEIVILAIVNEVYFSYKYGKGAKDCEVKRLTIEHFTQKDIFGFAFSEFGMRRRYSSKMQEWILDYIIDTEVPGFVGTSNVYLAMQNGIKAIGTQAHEFFMAQQGHFERNPAYSNMFALKAWVKEYETKLGIALTDTLGTDLFLKDFGLTYATLFSGVRHDSGDPYDWGEKIIKHYESLGIDPKTKTLLFSDGLDFRKANSLWKYFRDRAKVAFGIGTYITNPLPDPLNIVFKMTECNGSPVAKISNTPSKGMCRDDRYVDYLGRCIRWRLDHE